MTSDGKTVVSGLSVFKFSESKGVPLDFILSILDKEEYVTFWTNVTSKVLPPAQNGHVDFFVPLASCGRCQVFLQNKLIPVFN